MTRLTATAFGLDSLPDDDWRQYARCRGRWDEWTEFISIQPDNTGAARAAHICRQHCVVYAKCLEATEELPPEQGIVQAGMYNRYGRGLAEMDDSHVECDCRPAAVRESRAQHGSSRRYEAGCRCVVCVETKRANDQKYRQRRAQRRELALAGAR